MSKSFAALFDRVFDLGFSDGLPLHVAGRIQAPTLQRDDVIGDVAGAGTDGFSVEGLGCRRWNSRRAAADRCAGTVRRRWACA
jgi:hypothetical protein